MRIILPLKKLQTSGVCSTKTTRPIAQNYIFHYQYMIHKKTLEISHLSKVDYFMSNGDKVMHLKKEKLVLTSLIQGCMNQL